RCYSAGVDPSCQNASYFHCRNSSKCIPCHRVQDDEQEQIVSNHEQITYMPVRDCNTKHNIYLLYPNRPKNLSINYSIRIDAFDKITLDY
ncbi:unnamed protein product, partial [Rotaria sp. Silwood1]